MNLTDRLVNGGIDAGDPGGGTPWRSTIGSYVSEAAAPQDNSYDLTHHATIASYAAFVKTAEAPDECIPLAVVVLTDGNPSGGEGGAGLYANLASLRNDWGIPTYVVGTFNKPTALNDMACAAAGACDGTCSSPCDDGPADSWDTCSTPGSSVDCAFVANDTDELEDTLSGIIADFIQVNVQTGTGAVVNDSIVNDGDDDDELYQTVFQAFTEVPEWKGHVVREYCDTLDEMGVLEEFCTAPSPEFSVDDSRPTFGPCPQSRDWDAGECLRMTNWSDRRVYTHDSSNNLIPILNGTSAHASFVAELQAQGLLVSSDPQSEADGIAEFLLGRYAPDNWKLPGLASSGLVVVRRIPEFNSAVTPEVQIRDPHCGGRYYNQVDAGALPDSLEDLARDASDETLFLSTPADHEEYQEAVLVGDDMGMLHAFQLDSGNELWGFVPRFALSGLAQQAAGGGALPGSLPVEQPPQGAASVGQPPALEDHLYGLSATLNHGWVHDEGADPADPADGLVAPLGHHGDGTGGNRAVCARIFRT